MTPDQHTEATTALTCIPEWCEQKPGRHDPTCPRYPMNMKKAHFVTAAEGGAKAAVEAYRFLREDEGFDHEAAVERVIDEAHEAAVCFAGIGSCGRGWCHHS